jgi:CheY-like chemotaxis protein
MWRVVLVDDRATNRAIYTQLARSIGPDVEVNAFGDAAGALDWLAKNDADLIVTDYDMPRIDGEEFITRFRGLPRAGGVPIVMITVCDQRQLRLRALESGATDFLRAPIDHSEFLTRARNLLKLSRSTAPAGPMDLRARSPEGEAPARSAADASDGVLDAAIGEEERHLLKQCGEGGYALHFIEIVPTGAAPDLTPALRAHLRGGDLVARIGPFRYALAQAHVTDVSRARTLADRLARGASVFDGVAAFKIGSALPGAGEGTPLQRAAACFREAMAGAREIERFAVREGARDNWRLAPVVDLATGNLAGAQFLRGGAPAEIADVDALRAALSCASELRLAPDAVFRMNLRLNFLAGEAEASLLRLPPLLVQSGVKPSRFDLVVCAEEFAADRPRAERLAQALKMLGSGMTVDVGDLSAGALQEARFWSPLLRCVEQGLLPAIRFACRDEGGVETGRYLHARTLRDVGKAAALCAAGVPSSALLPRLRRAGVEWAKGPCFGAPFAPRGFETLLAARSGRAGAESEARRA